MSMRLFVTDDRWNYDDDYPMTATKHNPNVDYVCYCSNPDCRGYGTRNQYGRDEFCSECGQPLDWSKEKKW